LYVFNIFGVSEWLSVLPWLPVESNLSFLDYEVPWFVIDIPPCCHDSAFEKQKNINLDYLWHHTIVFMVLKVNIFIPSSYGARFGVGVERFIKSLKGINNFCRYKRVAF
jgi:hypothetical protein